MAEPRNWYDGDPVRHAPDGADPDLFRDRVNEFKRSGYPTPTAIRRARLEFLGVDPDNAVRRRVVAYGESDALKAPAGPLDQQANR